MPDNKPNRSARDNIAYGRPEASESEIIAAARAAEGDEFIAHMLDHQGRKGYDAFPGGRGGKLAGGQRQHRPCPRLPEGRADPGAGRGDVRA